MRVYNVREVSIPADVVTLAEAKLHCRVDHSTEDALITRLMDVARRQCEQISGWAFTTRTLVSKLDCWPGDDCIVLSYPPLQSVTSIEYTDSDDDSHTLSSANYVVDTYSVPGRVVLKSSGNWPSGNLQVGGAITITYVAGFGGANVVPAEYKQAMLMMVGDLYNNREGNVVQQGVSRISLQDSIDRLLRTNGVFS